MYNGYTEGFMDEIARMKKKFREDDTFVDLVCKRRK